MTPAAVLNTSLLGYGWVQRHRSPASGRDLFSAGTQENLDPRSLQAVITPEEQPLEELQEGPEQTEQGSIVWLLQQSHRVRLRDGEITPQADAARLGDVAVEVLGENGRRRFQEFSRYEAGWDVGRGAPLSLRSVTVLNTFLTQLPELAAYQPSLFLTPNGNLELGWEDSNGNAIEIEFWPNRIGYYLEGLDEERTVRLEVFPQFIEKVRSLIS